MQAALSGLGRHVAPCTCLLGPVRPRWAVSTRSAGPAYQLYRGGRATLRHAVSADSDYYAELLPRGMGVGLLDDEPDSVHEVSAEFRQLCQQQIALLLGALEASMAATAAGGGGGGAGPEGGAGAGAAPSAAGAAGTAGAGAAGSEGAGAGASLAATLCCAVYARTAPSIQSGALQLQLVAHGSTGGAAGCAGGPGRLDQQSLLLGRRGGAAGGPFGAEEQEAWIVEQAIIVLPESGGLVLPLPYNGFLLGLLVVERGSPAPELGSAPSPLLEPPTCTLLGPREFQLLKQGAGALAMACAMDLRASLERAGNVLKQRQVRGLVQQARKPLSTLRTLTTMLTPRLQEGEPDRDMAEGIMAQGDRLAELVGQLQAALHPPPPPAPPPGPALGAAAGGGGAARRLPLEAGTPPPRGPRPLLRGPLGGRAAGPGAGAGALGAVAGRERPDQLLYPALPSSSIGSDSAGRTIDLEEGESWSGGGGLGGASSLSSSLGSSLGVVAAADAGSWGSASGGGGGGGSIAGGGLGAAVGRVMGFDEAMGTGALPLPAAPAPPAPSPPSRPPAGHGSGEASALAAAQQQPASGDGVVGSGGGLATARVLGAAAPALPPLASSPSSAWAPAQVPPHPSVSGLAAAGPAAGPLPAAERSDLLNVLMPLLGTAVNFCSVKGITFLMLPGDSMDALDPPEGEGEGHSARSGHSGSAPRRATTGLPCADVAVAAPVLKRMLSQLIDGVIACAARGDIIEVAVHSQQWEGRPGVAVTLGCLQDFTHAAAAGAQAGLSGIDAGAGSGGFGGFNGGGGGGGGGADYFSGGAAIFGAGAGAGGRAGAPAPAPRSLSRQPEFAFLAPQARQAGGWFEVKSHSQPVVVEDPRHVQHLNCSSLIAVLWLPVAS